MSSLGIDKDGETAIGEAKGSLGVLLVYEDFGTGLRARQVFEKVARQLHLEADFRVGLWKLDLLRETALFERAANEAAEADIVFLSVHGQGQLPERANMWVEQWFERKGGEPCALVASFDALAGGTTAASQTWDPLCAAARMAGVEVFLDAAEPGAL